MSSTLEEQIDQVIDDFQPWRRGNTRDGWLPISEWSGIRNFDSEAHSGSLVVKKINFLVVEATLAECLTSPSEYIREYRKWYEANKKKKKKSNV